MNMKTKIFRTGDKVLPQLYYDIIFVEMAQPIFFTCQDDCENLYACSCYYANGEKCEWLVVKTTPEVIIETLTDSIQLRECFTKSDEDAYIITLRQGSHIKQAKKVSVGEIPNDVLPTTGCYMEPDPGEFDDEVSVLKKRIESETEANQISISEVFISIIRSFPVSFSLYENNMIDERNHIDYFVAPYQRIAEIGG